MDSKKLLDLCLGDDTRAAQGPDLVTQGPDLVTQGPDLVTQSLDLVRAQTHMHPPTNERACVSAQGRIHLKLDRLAVQSQAPQRSPITN